MGGSVARHHVRRREAPQRSLRRITATHVENAARSTTCGAVMSHSRAKRMESIRSASRRALTACSARAGPVPVERDGHESRLHLGHGAQVSLFSRFAISPSRSNGMPSSPKSIAVLIWSIGLPAPACEACSFLFISTPVIPPTGARVNVCATLMSAPSLNKIPDSRRFLSADAANAHQVLFVRCHDAFDGSEFEQEAMRQRRTYSRKALQHIELIDQLEQGIFV
jgi:hypothetical protein